MAIQPSFEASPELAETAAAADDAAQTFRSVVGSRASQTTLRNAISRESVWLPKRAAGGHGLRADDLLRYAVGVDRADNSTGHMTWTAKTIDARCGITTKTPRPVSHLLRMYREAGLLAADAVTFPPGQAARVVFEEVPASDSIRIPLGVLWEHRWTQDAPTGPRYGDDSRYVLVWLAAWLRTATYGQGGITYTSRLDDDGLPMTSAWIAGKAGLTLRAYRRAWETARRVLADAAWITWERTYRADDGHHTYRINIDWSLAPVLKSIESPQTPPTSGQGAPSNSGQGDPQVLVTLSSLSASPSVLPSQTHAARNTKTATKPETEGGKEKSTVIPLKPTTTDSALDAAVNGVAPEATENDTELDDAATYRLWWLTVIAGITGPDATNPIPLTARDALAAREPLQALHNGGWEPAPLARWLTHSETPDNPRQGLLWRIKHAPATPEDAPTRSDYAATRKQNREDAAYDLAASSREAKFYTQHHM